MNATRRIPGTTALALLLAAACLPPAAAQDPPPPDAWRTHVEGLQSPDAALRFRAAEALWRLGPPAWPAAPDLAAALSDPDVRVRRMSAQALCGMGDAASACLLEVGQALRDEDEEVRLWAGRIVWWLGPKAGPLLRDVLDVLQDARAVAMLPLLRALRAMGPLGREAETRLLELSLDRRDEVAAAAAAALCAFWPEGADRGERIRRAVEEMQGRDETARGRAGRLLEVLGPEALRAAEPVVGAEPGRLSFEAEGMQFQIRPGEAVHFRLKAKNLADRPFWIPSFSLQLRGGTESFWPLVMDRPWGKVPENRRTLRAVCGDGRGPFFPLGRYEFLLPGQAFDLGGHGTRAGPEAGTGFLHVRVQSPPHTGPCGIRPWHGEWSSQLRYVVADETIWAPGGEASGGLRIEASLPSPGAAGAEARLTIRLVNAGTGPLGVPALTPERLDGLWVLVAHAETDLLLAMDTPGRGEKPAVLDPRTHAAVLAPGEALSLSLPVPLPEEPGAYRLRVGVGRCINPDGLRLGDAALWEGVAVSSWTPFETE